MVVLDELNVHAGSRMAGSDVCLDEEATLVAVDLRRQQDEPGGAGFELSHQRAISSAK
jgi:hypothetical protein